MHQLDVDVVLVQILGLRRRLPLQRRLAVVRVVVTREQHHALVAQLLRAGESNQYMYRYYMGVERANAQDTKQHNTCT